LTTAIETVPDALAVYNLELVDAGRALLYSYDRRGERTGITSLLADLASAGLTMRDLQTKQSSLEDIFVGLVAEDAA